MPGYDNHPAKRKKRDKPSNTPKKASPSKPLPNFSDPSSQVTFLIGPDSVEFKVHKEFVCHYSSVLKAAFNSSFIEGQTQTYKLDDTSVGAFRFFVQWIYQQKLDIAQFKSEEEKDTLKKNNREWDSEEDIHLYELWILADKFAMPALQNLVMDHMVEIFGNTDKGVATPNFQYIYDHTAVESPLRRWILVQCTSISEECLLESPEEYPRDLLLELAVFMLKEANSKRKFIWYEHMESSRYHVSIHDA